MKTIAEYKFKLLEKFLNDKSNWRPPSLSRIAKLLGYKSKVSAKKALIRLKIKNGQQVSVNEMRLLKKLPIIKQ